MFRFQSLVIPEKFQHILRILGTNIDGKRKVMFALTAIKGVGRRYSNIVLKKADVDLDKRAGECSEEEVEKIITIMSNPRQYKIPDWFLNRQKDIIDGKYSQVGICLTIHCYNVLSGNPSHFGWFLRNHSCLNKFSSMCTILCCI